MIEQLWYGWTLRGAGGVVGEQVIAASAGLSPISSPQVRRVLDWITHNAHVGLAWVERDGLGLAFKRTAIGDDAFGRGGVTFVHALVWQPGALPVEVLAGLAHASVWQTAPPPEPPTRLDTIADAEGLGAPTGVGEPDGLPAATAQVLAALAANEPAVLPASPDEGAAIAGRIAAIMPSRYGPLSFAAGASPTDPVPFDVVAGHPALQASSAPDDRWLAAADLLLHGDGGDGAVAALAERMGSRQRFAGALGAWVDVERKCRSRDEMPGEVGARLIASDPRLLRRLSGTAEEGLARLIVRSPDGEAILRSATTHGLASALEAHISSELARMEARSALERLSRLQAAGLDDPGRILAAIAQGWDERQLDGLHVSEAVRAAEAVARLESNNAHRVLVRLTEPAERASAMVASALPVDWRAHVARRNLHGVGSGLTAAAQDSRFVEALLKTDSSGRARDALTQAVLVAPMQDALRAAEHLADNLADPTHRWAVLWPTLKRLPAGTRRLAALDRWAPRDAAEAPHDWLRVAIDTYIQVVLRGRNHHRPLPRTDGPALSVRSAQWHPDLSPWIDLFEGLRRPYSAPARVMTLAALKRLDSKREFDAAMETVLERLAVEARDYYAWSSAMRDTHRLEDSARFVPRTARTLSRTGCPGAFFLIRWLADELDDKQIDRGPLDDALLATVCAELRLDDLPALECLASDKERRRTTRRWVGDILDEAQRGHSDAPHRRT